MSEEHKAKRARTDKYENQILSQTGDKLYLNSKMADIYFVFEADSGSPKRIPAHKTLLAAASSVFNTIFTEELNKLGDVTIVDTSVAAFVEFLQFFYLKEVKLTFDNILEVFHLGREYKMPKCFDVCVKFLKNTLNDDEICIGLGLAILYNQNELKQFCEKRIAINAKVVFASQEFLKCDEQVLAHILNMDLLFFCPETEVFEACMCWVKTKSKQNQLTREIVQEHLGELFYEIRFASMTSEDFAALYSSYESIFSHAEYIDVNQMITLANYQPKMFKGKPRTVQWNKDAIIKCKRASTHSKGIGTVYMKSTEITTFSANEPILLGGFVCASLTVYYNDKHHDLRSDLPVNVKIVEVRENTDDDVKILSIQKSSLSSRSKTISLLKLVLVRPGFQYKILVRQFPENHCYYAREFSSKATVEGNVTVRFHNDQSVQSKTYGLISALEFNRI